MKISSKIILILLVLFVKSLQTDKMLKNIKYKKKEKKMKKWREEKYRNRNKLRCKYLYKVKNCVFLCFSIQFNLYIKDNFNQTYYTITSLYTLSIYIKIN